MLAQIISIKSSLNKAYLKLPPSRSQIETLKRNFIYLFKQVKSIEGEEYHKNEISEFLKKTYYSPNHYINTKGRYDLVIHNGKDSGSNVGVIVEAKSPGNLFDMPKVDNLNSKAIRELMLYYLRERITNKNLELKHLIATNLNEWFIFDAHEFEKHFANNKSLVKQFTDFEEGRSSGKDTFFFYNSIAAPYLESLESEIRFTHFDLRNYETIITNNNPEDDTKLIPLFKILSPEHLLKLQFKNDSNSLDKDFYRELLHIIGLEETKQGNKKLIGRASEKVRNYGSLLESAISILNIEDCITHVPRLSDFGETKEEQLFNISLELVITWINRVLFLKLLEGQLVRYNQGDKGFRFLERDVIPDYDALNKLFFCILAIPEPDRDERLRAKFSRIPYLNSSLFEPTDLEHKTIRISNLDDGNKLPILKSTVLKDTQGKRISGEKPTLIYLFDFLDAYNFSSEGSKGIQEENKTLINASVLGLIFEKINGYKDGSFFTPGFITQYMCHETITRAVIQKFNEAKGWNCRTLNDLYNKIEDKLDANKIINNLRICDPAVGSGHFLVSALNELISIKSELKILMDRKGRVLRDYHFEVINDELMVSDPDNELFEYNPRNSESHRVQEAIFHEKQTIIESCLFGVDINPNSVKICRLRLWIELLKHAYYKPGPQAPELETLPNIDINIKCGNSLISRYPLDADIKTALKSSKWTVENYREAVMIYRNADSKDQKRSMERLISEIKSNFEYEISKSDKRFIKLNKLKGELLSMTAQQGMFELEKKKKIEWNNKVKKLSNEQKSLELQLDELKNNKIYENALEWRFEFPEVLNEKGDFIGFDVILGNPPYIRQESFANIKLVLKQKYSIYHPVADLLTYFVEQGFNLLNNNGAFSFIVSNKFSRTDYGKLLRGFLVSRTSLTHYIDFSGIPVFDEATVDAAIIGFDKKISSKRSLKYSDIKKSEFVSTDFESYIKYHVHHYPQEYLTGDPWVFENPRMSSIKQKIECQGIPLKNWNVSINYGIKTGFNDAFVINHQKYEEFENQASKYKVFLKPLLRGRDIQKFTPDFHDLWLIYIPKGFTLSNFFNIKNNTSSSVEQISEEIAWDEFGKQYPAITQHLLPYKKFAEKRSDIGDFWWEQRACAYLEDFEKPKIIYPNMTKFLPFVIDTEGHYYHNDKSFHLISDNIGWLGSFFNSKLFSYCFKNNFPELLGGTRELRKVFFERIPVKQISEEIEDSFRKLIYKMILSKRNNLIFGISQLDQEMNKLVYEVYEVTPEEITIIEQDYRI